MKSNIELLLILQKEYKIIPSWKIISYYQGLCAAISYLFNINLITRREYTKLKTFLNDNSPKEQYDPVYYWKPGVKAPRLRWMTDNIRQLKQSS